MNSDSWASYRAASFQERDDDDPPPPGPTGPPDWFAVEWFVPVTYRDVDSGEFVEITAPVNRYFVRDRHADPEKAARRWAQAMADRKGVAWLREGWDGFPDLNFETKFTRAVKPESPSGF